MAACRQMNLWEEKGAGPFKAAREGTVSRPFPFHRLEGSAWANTGYPLSPPGLGYGRETQGIVFPVSSSLFGGNGAGQVFGPYGMNGVQQRRQ